MLGLHVAFDYTMVTSPCYHNNYPAHPRSSSIKSDEVFIRRLSRVLADQMSSEYGRFGFLTFPSRLDAFRLGLMKNCRQRRKRTEDNGRLKMDRQRRWTTKIEEKQMEDTAR